jgi:DNA polymerase-3 subunit epsilon
VRGGADGGGCFPTGRHYPGIAHLLRVVAAGIAREFGSDARIADLPLVSIDTETTGRDFESDRIVELALVFWRNGEVTDRLSWLVNPGRPIPDEAKAVHGIGDEDVKDKPSFKELAPQFLEVMQGMIPVAYNADFDRRFIESELRRAGFLATLPEGVPCLRREVVWIDPLTWARELQKEEKSRSLGDVCARLGIEIGQAHRATFDAEAALRVLLVFAEDARVPRTYGAFVQEQRRLARAQSELARLWRAKAS